MQNNTPERGRNRRHNKLGLKRWRDERDELVRRNVEYVNERLADFRQKMLRLTRSASSGDPARAVSSAVSCPNHMCEALLFVLSSLFRIYDIDIKRVHFKIQGSSLIMEKVTEITSAGHYMSYITPFGSEPSIEVKIGDLQRASLGYGSDHDCQGLCCDDERHGLTRIVCPRSFDLSQMTVSKEVEIKSVRRDGSMVTDKRYIRQFSPIHHRGSLWTNRVSVMEPIPFQLNQEFVVRYLDNEVTGLPDVLMALFIALF